MYLWKCWRDTRSTFLVFLGSILAVGALGAYVAFDPFGWVAASPREVQNVWSVTSDAFLTTCLFLVPLLGFVFGAIGVGKEFEKGTLPFLLTRPLARHNLVWSSWAVGFAEILLLVIASVLQLRFLHSRLAHPFETRMFRDILIFAVVASVIYGVTFLMTILARSERKGMNLGVATVVGYTGLQLWVAFGFGIELPGFWALYSKLSGSFTPIPWLTLLAWFGVATAFVLVAQLWFQRVEV